MHLTVNFFPIKRGKEKESMSAVHLYVFEWLLYICYQLDNIYLAIYNRYLSLFYEIHFTIYFSARILFINTCKCCWENKIFTTTIFSFDKYSKLCQKTFIDNFFVVSLLSFGIHQLYKVVL